MRPRQVGRSATFACCAAVCLFRADARAGQVQQSIPPVHDAFVRAAAPGTNYGAAGALHVSGPQGVNAFGAPQGRYDTMLMFNTADAVAAFDLALGAGNWSLTAIELQVYEVGVPANPIFSVGIGQTDIAWFSDDNWVEGPGSPFGPVGATGNQMSWNLLQSMLTTATEVNIGSGVNTQVSATLLLPLTQAPELVADILSGGPVSLHLAPASPTVGFTFHAKNFLIEAEHPFLVLTASGPTVIGDLNCDATLDLADIDAFALALTDPAAYTAAYPGCDINSADFNGDTLLNGADIPTFIDLLLAP